MNLGDYAARKRAQLGLDRGDALAAIQRELDARYPGLCRARSLNRGVLRITTTNAAVASELRFRQLELLRTLQAKTGGVPLERLQIGIGSLG